VKKIIVLALAALGLMAGGSPPPARAVPTETTTAASAGQAPKPSFLDSPKPVALFLDRGDVRELALGGDTVWAATSGGLVSFDLATMAERSYGTEDGLDTMDVRHVTVAANVVVDTAFSRCEKSEARFTCRPHASEPPQPRETDTFAGHPVTARLRTQRGEFVGTRGAGLWLDGKPLLAAGPGSFLKAAAKARGALYLGLFDGGVARMALDDKGEPRSPIVSLRTPFRMVNDLLEVDGALFVAANEGLYVSRDGKKFERVPAIGAKSITGLAVDASGVWLTSSESLYRIDRSGRGKTKLARLHPAGSRSIQGLALAPGGVWLATEDRGLVWFDGHEFHAKDRLAGLPTSWMVGVASDGAGGAFGVTLRDGALHVGPSGAWERSLAAGTWGQTVARIGKDTCFGMQEGASCGPLRFAGLPDPRVHVMAPIGGKILVGTEAGMALYDANL
jgi:hypothetical protein